MIRLAALGRPADPRTDGALLAAFLDGRDEPAFAELVRRHAGLVWGVCRRGLPDPADAEDAFQATFLVLVRRAHRLTASATVGPWLYRVAAWTARALRRKNARRLARRRDLPTTLPAPSVPESPFDLDAALLGLPDRYRQAVVLCCLGGLTHREAADRLGCAEGTVSSLVSRGLGKLRARLAADPTPVLAIAAVAAAPAGLSAAAVKSAAALQLASLSAAASPAVAGLTEGVLRMFWVKKAAAAGLAAVMLVTTGVGVGVSVHQPPQAVAADDKPITKAAKPAPPADVAKMEAELKEVRDKLREISLRSWRLTEPEIEEYGRLSGRAAELEARIKVATAPAGEKKDLPAIRQLVELETRQRELFIKQRQLVDQRTLLDIQLHQLAEQIAELNAAGTAMRRVVITMTGDPTAPLRAKETRVDGSTAWTVTFHPAKPSELSSLRAYLDRAKRDPNGPPVLQLDSEGVENDYTLAVVMVCRAAGYHVGGAGPTPGK